MGFRLTKTTANALKTIRESKSTNVVDMALEIGADPTTFFEGGDWSGLDLRDCELNGVSFRGAIIDGVKVYADQYKMIMLSEPNFCSKPIVTPRSKDRRSKKISKPPLLDMFHVYSPNPYRILLIPSKSKSKIEISVERKGVEFLNEIVHVSESQLLKLIRKLEHLKSDDQDSLLKKLDAIFLGFGIPFSDRLGAKSLADEDQLFRPVYGRRGRRAWS